MWKKTSQEPPPKDKRILAYNCNCEIQFVVKWDDGVAGPAWYENEESYWHRIDYWDELQPDPVEGMNDPILAASEKIMRDRHKHIDLFCTTFLLAQEPKTVQELRDMFPFVELECRMGENMSQTFRIKLRDN